MAFARFSDETRINEMLAAHKLSIAFLSALAGHAGVPRTSHPTLAAGLGGKGLKIETSQPLLALLKEIEKLNEIVKPLRLNFGNAAEVYSWLILVREGRLKLFVVDENDQLVQRQ